MKVIFFGSSHAVPEPNRKCSCIFLEVGQKKYLIDMGTDPTEQLVNRGLTPNDISAIFITHLHGDHVNGLVPFLDLCSWYYLDAKPEIYLPDLQAIDIIRRWVELVDKPLPEDLHFSVIGEGPVFDDGVIRVTALRTGHLAKSFAFLVEAEGKKALFTGDLKHKDGPEADYARFVEGQTMDLVVTEGAHFSPMQYAEVLKKDTPKRFCLTHYSASRAEDAYRLRSTVKDTVPFYLASDGLEIEF